MNDRIEGAKLLWGISRLDDYGYLWSGFAAIRGFVVGLDVVLRVLYVQGRSDRCL